jgi:hypothetical protein
MGVKISGLTAKGTTIADTDLVEVSQSAGGGLYTSRSVTGANIKALVTDANMTTSDITTNDVSTAKHGFAPKAPNDTAKFLRGDGTWAVPASGGLTEFTEAETTAAPNGTVPVNSLTPVTATTNADVAIVPKGTGAFTLDIADNTSAGGNKRGANAIDLSTKRTNAADVASGASSIVIGETARATNANSFAVGLGAVGSIASGSSSISIGNWTTATGNNSFSSGSRCDAPGLNSVSIGGFLYGATTASGESSFASGGATASGDYSLAIGPGNIASGRISVATGNNSHTFGISGRQAHSAGVEATQGDSQASKFILRERTTNDTATTITTDSNAAGTTNQVILSNQSAYRFKGSIVGKQSGSTNAAVWDIDGFLVRGANAAATTLNVSNVTLVENTPAWGTPTLAADTTNGGLRVQVTGAAATNIQWTAVIDTTEVIYA